MPITKALTERRNAEIDRYMQLGNFQKKKSMDRSSGELPRKLQDNKYL